MVDYRKFLDSTATEVLPYVGGPFVESETRRLRVVDHASRPEPGWWSFEISGRTARAIAPAEPPDLSSLPSVRGHLGFGYLFAAGSAAERFALPIADEPELFAPGIGRRWPSGDLLFDGVDFEGDAEDTARRAFEDGEVLRGLKGVPATLRAAFGFAVLRRAARERETFVVPMEVANQLGEVADQGTAAANAVLDRLLTERAVERALRRAATVRPTRRRPVPTDPIERAAEALAGSGAALLAARRVGDTLVVRYRFLGERWESVVDIATLRVYDAGLCLAGRDGDLTLESLPSAIREAIDEGIVHVTRYVAE